MSPDRCDFPISRRLHDHFDRNFCENSWGWDSCSLTLCTTLWPLAIIRWIAVNQWDRSSPQVIHLNSGMGVCPSKWAESSFHASSFMAITGLSSWVRSWVHESILYRHCWSWAWQSHSRSELSILSGRGNSQCSKCCLHRTWSPSKMIQRPKLMQPGPA